MQVRGECIHEAEEGNLVFHVFKQRVEGISRSPTSTASLPSVNEYLSYLMRVQSNIRSSCRNFDVYSSAMRQITIRGSPVGNHVSLPLNQQVVRVIFIIPCFRLHTGDPRRSEAGALHRCDMTGERASANPAQLL